MHELIFEARAIFRALTFMGLFFMAGAVAAGTAVGFLAILPLELLGVKVNVGRIVMFVGGIGGLISVARATLDGSLTRRAIMKATD